MNQRVGVSRPGPRDGLLDLFLGGSCLGCRAPGRVLCGPCRARLLGEASPRRLDPMPPGLAAVSAVAPYAGLVRELVIGHKERQLVSLRPVLAALLARSVLGVLEEHEAQGAVLLVPVPSRAASVRARGRDATREMTACAGEVVRQVGAGRYDVTLAPVLRSRPGVVDQAGLDVTARRANLDGSMACSSSLVRRLGRRVGAAHVVVCDDVVTTGATLAEAQRALGAAGVGVLGHACLAATERRGPGTGAT